MSKTKRSLALAAVVTLGAASAAQAGTFYTVATYGENMPGYGVPFGSFSNNPGIATDGSDVVFVGAASVTSTTQMGIYDYNIASQSLTLVAGAGNAAPDGGTYKSVGQPAVNDGTVSFYGATNLNTGVGGIYTANTSGGSAAVLASTSTVIPGSSPSANFGTIENYSNVSGPNVILEGGKTGSGSSGIYLSNNGGALSKVFDNSSTPAVGPFPSWGDFLGASIAGNTIAFDTQTGTGGSQAGIYTSSITGANPTFIIGANNNGTAGASTVPGIGGTFTHVYGPVTDGTNVGVYGTSTNGGSGLFLYSTTGGTGTTVLTSSTYIPGHGTTATFNPTYSATYAISNGYLAFNGGNTAGTVEGIYAFDIATGSLTTVMEANNSLYEINGEEFTYAALLGEGIANGVDDYAFYGTLSDGTTGIFLDPVAVPEPCTLGLLGMSSLLVLRRRRRRAIS